MKEWTRGSRIVLEANPEFREMTLDEPGDEEIVRDLAGKRDRWCLADDAEARAP